MKTLNTLISIATIALCCSNAARAEQNAPAKVAELDASSREEMIITAPRVTTFTGAVLSTADRSALLASIKLETHKEIRQSMEQFKTAQVLPPAKTALQSPNSESLQASL